MTGIPEAIDDMDENITDMSEQDFIRVIAGNSREAFEFRRVRKKIRYHLYRFQTERLGGPASIDKTGLRERFEGMSLFQGWRFFGVTWDVALDDPMQIVSRDHSVAEEWEQIIRAKFPQIEPGTGKVRYPDIKVKQAVEKEAALQAKVE